MTEAEGRKLAELFADSVAKLLPPPPPPPTPWIAAMRYVIGVGALCAMALMASLVGTDTRLEQRIDRVATTVDTLGHSTNDLLLVATKLGNQIDEHTRQIATLDAVGGRAFWEFKVDMMRRLRGEDANKPDASAPLAPPRPPTQWAARKVP